MKNNLKKIYCFECGSEADWALGYCPVCDCSFEGEPLDLDFLSEEEHKELLKE